VTTELVQSARRGAVHTITLDSPHNRNALSGALLEQLVAAVADAAHRSVRVVVLSGTGPVFCSGADLSEGAAAAANRLPDILHALRGLPAPVIARVNGHARAGGVGLIAASDLAVAPAAASFAFSEVRVGVAPAMILVPALRVVERRFLARAVLTGEPFDAAAAASAGLLSDVVPDADALDEWVADATASILQGAPGAVAATKALLAVLPERGWHAGLAEAQVRSAALFAGPEAAEGMAAFLEKRPAAWRTDGDADR
jgi:methylglutaconyl-CoA hydratase